ncbi:MAG: hypothetical protein EPO21_18015 [Chloroflexota bacterium]|nr:MAG: hypothetical protein EPO21_18015 [Chloroflexota bacterium]
MKTPPPIWEVVSTHSDSLADAVDVVSAEGVSRLLLEPLSERITSMQYRIHEAVGEHSIDVVGFFEDLQNEVLEVAARIGFALAGAATLEGYEAWLQAALSKAGLGQYTIPEVLRGESEVQP